MAHSCQSYLVSSVWEVQQSKKNRTFHAMIINFFQLFSLRSTLDSHLALIPSVTLTYANNSNTFTLYLSATATIGGMLSGAYIFEL